MNKLWLEKVIKVILEQQDKNNDDKLKEIMIVINSYEIMNEI